MKNQVTSPLAKRFGVDMKLPDVDRYPYHGRHKAFYRGNCDL